jgi:hypothetical protein
MDGNRPVTIAPRRRRLSILIVFLGKGLFRNLEIKNSDNKPRAN